MTKFNEELKLIVEKNLPAIQAEELKNFFIKLEKLELENENLNKEIEYQKDIIADYRAKEWKYENAKKIKAEAEASLNETKRLEMDFKIKELEYKLSCETNITNRIMSLSELVFKNRYIKKEIFKSNYNSQTWENNDETYSEVEKDSEDF